MGYNLREATIEHGKRSFTVYFNMHSADFVDLLQEFIDIGEPFEAHKLSIWLARKIKLEKTLLEQTIPPGWVILPKDHFDRLLMDFGYETNTSTIESPG